jgi:hypothetical protein
MDLEQRGIGVVARFFEAFATLAAEHSILEVSNTCGIDRRNLYNKRNGVWGMRTIPVAWLSALVAYYGVSAEWLLIGKGEMFN